MKTSYLLTFFVFPFLLAAQYDYEPSKEHPFGLPNPEAPNELLDFAPMIGECNCKSEMRNPDQSWAEPVDLLWRFKYIMNGTGVQDETFSDGFTSGSIRQFIPDSTRWYVHYYSSRGPTPTLPAWEGTKRDDGNIVLYREQKAPNGMDGFYRITFYEMSDKGFKWAGEWVSTDETIVYPTWKIDCSNGKKGVAQTTKKQQIVAASNRFSQAYMDGNLEGIMASYTKDAKNFPPNMDIIGGEGIRQYWTPRDNGSKVIHHKISSEEIKFFGDYAHDYGYYEGKTKQANGDVSEWKGKYVVVWKKEGGQWKMYLDIWNRIRT